MTHPNNALRFYQIQTEISNLLDEALELLPDNHKEFAKRYWHSNMKSILNSTQEFGYTMEDSSKAFKYWELEFNFFDTDLSAKFALEYDKLELEIDRNLSDEFVTFEVNNNEKAIDLLNFLKFKIFAKNKFNYEVKISEQER